MSKRLLLLIVLIISSLVWISFHQPALAASNYALNFGGVADGTQGQYIDRVVLPVENTKLNIGTGAFTIEWWMKASAANNPSGPCSSANGGWINGNIIIDRDINGSPDFGDFGVSIYGGKVAFGAANDSFEDTICGSTTVTDDQWHHIAVTRSFTGSSELSIYVDGMIDAQSTAPTGDISYHNGRTGATWDPYLVLGAEKHDADLSAYPSYAGIMDELCISNTLKYTATFTRPSAPFTSANCSVALYHLNENDNSGTTLTIQDATTSPVNGTLRRQSGSTPQFVAADDAPFITGATTTPTGSGTPTGSTTPTNSPTPTPTIPPGDDPCIYRGGSLLCDTLHNSGAADFTLNFGKGELLGDYPFIGNISGMGGDEFCVYRGSLVMCDLGNDGNQAEYILAYGNGVAGGDYPVMGNVNGVGPDDICIYRNSNGVFYCDTGNNGGQAEYMRAFGRGVDEGDYPVIGNVDGVGPADLCIYRKGTFYCDTGDDGGVAETIVPFGRGVENGDYPLIGDLNGDGRDDFCIYRSIAGVYAFHCDTANNGGVAETIIPFGRGIPNGDFPIIGQVQ